jgi:hypothetical protein
VRSQINIAATPREHETTLSRRREEVKYQRRDEGRITHHVSFTPHPAKMPPLTSPRSSPANAAYTPADDPLPPDQRHAWRRRVQGAGTTAPVTLVNWLAYDTEVSLCCRRCQAATVLPIGELVERFGEDCLVLEIGGKRSSLGRGPRSC